MLQPSSLCYAVPSLKRRFYEALCVLHASGVSSTQKYEAQLTLHEAALRAMMRSLDRLHVFLPGIRAKKWGCSFCSRTLIS